MIIGRRSPLTGLYTEFDLPITAEQIARFEQPAHLREPIQDIFPDLSADEREFIKTGYTASDWKHIFGE